MERVGRSLPLCLAIVAVASMAEYYNVALDTSPVVDHGSVAANQNEFILMQRQAVVHKDSKVVEIMERPEAKMKVSLMGLVAIPNITEAFNLALAKLSPVLSKMSLATSKESKKESGPFREAGAKRVYTVHGCYCRLDWQYKGQWHSNCMNQGSQPWCQVEPGCAGALKGLQPWDHCKTMPKEVGTVTAHGCNCKLSWTYRGRVHRNCFQADASQTPWCQVEPGCPQAKLGQQPWDECKSVAPSTPRRAGTSTTHGCTCKPSWTYHGRAMQDCFHPPDGKTPWCQVEPGCDQALRGAKPWDNCGSPAVPVVRSSGSQATQPELTGMLKRMNDKLQVMGDRLKATEQQEQALKHEDVMIKAAVNQNAPDTEEVDQHIETKLKPLSKEMSSLGDRLSTTESKAEAVVKQQDEIDKVSDKLASLDGRLSAAESKSGSKGLKKVKDELSSLKDRLSASESQSDTKEEALDENNQKIEAFSEKLSSLKDRVKAAEAKEEALEQKEKKIIQAVKNRVPREKFDELKDRLEGTRSALKKSLEDQKTIKKFSNKLKDKLKETQSDFKESLKESKEDQVSKKKFSTLVDKLRDRFKRATKMELSLTKNDDSLKVEVEKLKAKIADMSMKATGDSDDNNDSGDSRRRRRRRRRRRKSDDDGGNDSSSMMQSAVPEAKTPAQTKVYGSAASSAAESAALAALREAAWATQDALDA